MAFPPYEKSHAVVLIGTLTSICVLITTLYTVWYPYLQTSQFVATECRAFGYIYYGPAECRSSSSPSCTALPTGPTVTNYFNFTTLSTSPAAMINATTAFTSVTTPATSGTPTTTVLPSSSPPSTAPAVGRRRRQAVTPNGTLPVWLSSVTPPNEPYCAWFPCCQLLVTFSGTYDTITLTSAGRLFTNYDQLQAYPQVNSDLIRQECFYSNTVCNVMQRNCRVYDIIIVIIIYRPWYFIPKSL
jgi:hypothetical protein